jgi:AcrR family transcriptional regulator
METEQLAKPGGKRERTRAALVEATLALIAEKGFAAASLDDIAARAGMTKGAIYSNFRSKGDLLLAAIGSKGLTLAPTRTPEASLREHLEAMAGELAQMLRRARGQAAFLAEFQLHALVDPEVRRSLAVTYSEAFDGNAAYLARLADLKPGVDRRRLAVGLQAVGLGFLMQSFLTPDEVTEEVIVETLRALVDGLAR